MGEPDQRHAARVRDDEPGALPDGLDHPVRNNGMVLLRVGADDDSTSLFSISAIEFVIAPEPNTVARPATVALCQSRAQWSTLFVPTAARRNF